MGDIPSYHIPSSTGRLFLLKELFSTQNGRNIMVLTDRKADIILLQNFAFSILGQEPTVLDDIGKLLTAPSSGNPFIIIPFSLIETPGKLSYLKKRETLVLKRSDHIAIEKYIEELIAYGYTHDTHLGEGGTYTRTGSIVSLETLERTRVQIEWFDEEVDNIIVTENDKRVFTDFLHLPKIRRADETKEEGGSVNQELLSYIGDTFLENTKIIFSGDFSPSIDMLREFADIHVSDFESSHVLPFFSKPIHISHIDELLQIIQQTPKPVHLYTRYQKTIEEFLEYHSLSSNKYHIHETTKPGLESLECEEHLVIADDIIAEIFVRKRVKKKSLAKNLDLLLSLKPGDFVVHREHGIAKFEKIIRKTIGEIEREYLELHYLDDDKLFVPITEIYRVSPYLSKGEPTLTKLSGKEWEKTIEKTEEEITEIAMGIIETSAKRALVKGRAFGRFRKEEKDFQEAFAYEYTNDQSSAIQDVFGDMEQGEAMDRLLSGDVGFGKTEVAMNAIYKAVLSGTQVAVISPLLVLADEHYETFSERLGAFGVRIGLLTRMNTPKEAEIILKKLKVGDIDVLVGTHRLLSHDIEWKRLGLLVVDEEHRFGVVHKERIKEMRANIDILSLSATPIPRTLNLALSGLRKISILATPPQKKKAIRTIVSSWNEQIIVHAMEHELARGGQVIILINRIRGMESLAKEIDALMGRKLRSIITHGQMPGDDIESRIHAFKKREYDVLISTTIIENGVNFLSANTILIIDPEDFGLASLHQLRGRVGRKDQEGFCYLLYRKPELTPDEKERLITIVNNSHLGAGFEIAMRDLEIRGAGDVLGIKQSGKSKDVGLTLYFRMLEEKIEELKDAKKKLLPSKIELDISYLLDADMFLSEQDKLQFFRDIENIETREELEDIETGFSQNLEEERKHITHNLFLLLKARIVLSEYMVAKVSKIGMNYVFDFHESVNPEIVKRFLEYFDRKKRMVLLSIKKIRVETRYWKTPEDFLEEITGGQ